MLSKLLPLSLIAAAGLNLSFWGTPLKAEELIPRAPSSECDSLTSKLFKGETNFKCEETYRKFHKEAHSEVEVSKQVQKQADGKEKTAYFVKIQVSSQDKSKTEGQTCTDCTTEEQTLVFDNLKDLSAIQNKVNATRNELQKKSLDKLDDQITFNRRRAKCLIDESGERLDKEEKAACLSEQKEAEIEKLADMDDEEANKFFSQKIEGELKKLLSSSDPAERARGLELLNKVKDAAYSDEVLKKANAMLASAQQVERINQMAQKELQAVQSTMLRAQNIMAIASKLPDGPQKQAYMKQAQQMIAGIETQVKRDQVTAYQGLLKSGVQDMAMYKTAIDGSFEKINATINEAYLSSPDLALLKARVEAQATASANGVSGTSSSVNNTTRLSRGGTKIPDQLLTGLPSVTGLPPANSSQLPLPNAGTMGPLTTRSVGQSRVPMIQPMQPTPAPVIQGPGYQSTYPLGTNFIQPPMLRL